MSLELISNKLPFLRDRARMLQKARDFFDEKGLFEIDTGALVRTPPNDSNIDVIGVDQDNGFLHTSPEYALKRLLAAGMGDCYFLGHVFRKNELGDLHNPEFTMAEWYRCGISFADMIQETCEFLFLFFEEKPIRILSFKEAFEKYVKIDYRTVSMEELHHLTHSSWPKQTCLHYLISHKIEPNLGRGELTVLIDYPPTEAALAKLTEKNGEKVAERYEIYHEGVELANGYHELSDALELMSRFQEKNDQRLSEGKEGYALDEKFLSSLKTLPDCCGVALGFDRALMLRHKLKSIKQVIPFAWDEI